MASRSRPFFPAHLPVTAEAGFRRVYVWQWPVRFFHWINAIAVTMLFSTGLYIAWPMLTPAGEAWHNLLMGRVRQVHFLCAYVFLVNYAFRTYWFWMGNRYARSGFPRVWRSEWWERLIRQAWRYLSLERGKVFLGHNPLAGVAYSVFVIGGGLFQILTGFALYSQNKTGGVWDHLVGWVIPLLGGPFRTLMWHHMMAWLFVVFVIVHLYFVFYDGLQHRNGLVTSIVSGEKFFQEAHVEDED